MGCRSPFQLNSFDAQSFTDDLGDYFDDIAPWGAMFVWKGRLILVFPKPDNTLVFSDVSGGIPWSQAPGGCIPASAFLIAMGRGEYISPTEAFFMALPENFMQVAKDRYDQAIALGQNLIHDIVDPALQPVVSLLWPLAIVAGVILAVMYLPKH